MPELPQHVLTLFSPPDDIDAVHDLLAEVWMQLPTISKTDRHSFETALIELTANVLRHADPGKEVTCTVQVETFSDRIEATLSDTGAAGEVELIERDMPHSLSESGRGIPLIQALVDELDYSRVGATNMWRMTRWFQL
ncbi:MAG: hypothetical protein JWR53_1109 [Glaciihabitans sp.]|nr:hypothetical protein [Glaciihabitans sp.]